MEHEVDVVRCGSTGAGRASFLAQRGRSILLLEEAPGSPLLREELIDLHRSGYDTIDLEAFTRLA